MRYVGFFIFFSKYSVALCAPESFYVMNMILSKLFAADPDKRLLCPEHDWKGVIKCDYDRSITGFALYSLVF